MKPLVPLLLSLCAVAASAAAPGVDDRVSPPPDARYKVDLLLVVAHPDDETMLTSYLAHAVLEEKKRVAVVFGTRGNGGGNAEGQEQSAALGAVREIEARRALAHLNILDVWFLNGLDTPSQDVLHSLETWDHGDSLGRLIRLVRLTRPSVIVTWLPVWVAGENHGDHQASAVLATEAFDSAGDPTVFPEQLAAPRNREDIGNLTEGLRPWQPAKLYFVSDTSHDDFLKGRGPVYKPTEKDAKLATEECAFHLTQSDTGQEAHAALAKNDFRFFMRPEYFIFGKSYVSSDETADWFTGVTEAPLPYHRASGFALETLSTPRVELGGPWRFYRQFWQAHDLRHLAKLVGPEILAKPNAPLVIPLVLENPSDRPVTTRFNVDLPEGWTVRRALPEQITASPHDSVSAQLEIKTAGKATSGWKNIAIDSPSGNIRIRTQLQQGAMPQ